MGVIFEVIIMFGEGCFLQLGFLQGHGQTSEKQLMQMVKKIQMVNGIIDGGILIWLSCNGGDFRLGVHWVRTYPQE